MRDMLSPGPRRRQGIEAAGAAYLEAPVSGSKGPAEAGQLVFLAGGDRALFDRAAPALDVMGKASFFLGPVRSPFPQCSGPYSPCPNKVSAGRPERLAGPQESVAAYHAAASAP